ncbi:sucrose phosphorylase [Paraglaciecola aquimarina]|uniref:Sucrose phosphorylase n=1 Tax=Paraglaciecola algarum TaxID=3050085 RepID=A0ABS9D9G5_9ALTE|nr:sucrose phosphorylase [Paraglaciecola sp. G1-23]MCF2949608.1 sucrose phosphorylase [Paraglaciecola sp. G1-23]
MSLNNKVQLITYVDRLGSGNLEDMNKVLNNQLKDLFGGVHCLPFYYPIDGSDAGFDPIDHTKVDERLGDWGDVKALGSQFEVMADMIVNHMSAESPQFKDVLVNGKSSIYYPLFLTKEKVFGENPSKDDLAKIYRPRPTPCFSQFEVADGQIENFWTTFTSNQIDIDVKSDAGEAYLDDIMTKFSNANVSLIRLDAAGYAIKKPGSNCFMLEETFEFIQELADKAKAKGMKCLVEIHSHYETQVNIAKKVDLVYDFALPPLIMHLLFTKEAAPLAKWLEVSPRNCVTVLDTHDGIGIIDVGKYDGKPGLLDDTSIDNLVEKIHKNSQGESQKATGAAASNVDLYQVNCTYYDALGADDKAYLLSRAIQFFCPGIPQVYYMGLLGIQNDMALLEKTNVGRDINRSYLDKQMIESQLGKPVVKGLCQLIKLRNNSSAFEGQFNHSLDKQQLILSWSNVNKSQAQLCIDLNNLSAKLTFIENEASSSYQLEDLLL